MQSNNQHLRFFVYIRRSSKSKVKQFHSIKSQKAELDTFVRENKFYVVGAFTESKTARKPGRPVFNDMLEQIKDRKADAILAWHPNRLSRNSGDSGELLSLLDAGVIKDFKFRNYWFENTPQGKFMLANAFAQAKYDIEEMSAGLARTFREKLRHGVAPSLQCLGYKFDKKTRTYLVDQEQAPFIKKLFFMVAVQKISVPRAQSLLTAAGFRNKKGKIPTSTTFYNILHNPTYYGVIPWKGERYPGSHEPLISKDVFEEAQRVLRGSKKSSNEYHHFLYRGAFHCGDCGSAITLEIQRKRLRYARCTKKRGPCIQPFLREEKLSKLVGKQVAAVTLREPWVRFLELEAKAQEKRNSEELEQRTQETKSQIEHLEQQLNGLLDLLLDKAIGQEEFSSKRNRIVDELVEIREKLRGFEKEKCNPLERYYWFFFWLNKGLELQRTQDDAEILTFFKFIGSNATIRNNLLHQNLRKPWKLAAEFNEGVASGVLKPFSKDTNEALCRILEAARTENDAGAG